MSETQQLTPWHVAAEQVLAVALRSERGFQRLRYEYGLDAVHFPPGPWRTVFQAVDGLRQENQAVDLVSVHDRADSVPLEWIGERWMLYSDALLDHVLGTNITVLKSRAKTFRNLSLLDYARSALNQAADDQARSEIIGGLITSLEIDLDTGFEDATAAAAGDRFASLMEAPPIKTLKTGIGWMDQLTGGFHSEQIWWIAAAYKMRKSSLMRNIVLNVARAGGSVTLCTLEGSQTLIVAQFVAMCAAEWMLKEGLSAAKDSEGRPLNTISATLLLTLRNRYKTLLDARQVAAIDYGIHEYKALKQHLRIYDGTPANGGLSNLGSIHTAIRRDKHLYGVDLVVVDYLQRISGGGASYFDHISRVALELQGIALNQRTTLLVLAQRNEQAVTGHEDEHSPGVKGGGDPAATADFLFLTKYPVKRVDGNMDKTQMNVECRLARHGEGGHSMDLPIHPASGLLIDPKMAVAPLDLAGF